MQFSLSSAVNWRRMVGGLMVVRRSRDATCGLPGYCSLIRLICLARSFDKRYFDRIEDLATLLHAVGGQVDLVDVLGPAARHARERVDGLARGEKVVAASEVEANEERAGFFADLAGGEEE